MDPEMCVTVVKRGLSFLGRGLVIGSRDILRHRGHVPECCELR